MSKDARTTSTIRSSDNTANLAQGPFGSRAARWLNAPASPADTDIRQLYGSPRVEAAGKRNG